MLTRRIIVFWTGCADISLEGIEIEEPEEEGDHVERENLCGPDLILTRPTTYLDAAAGEGFTIRSYLQKNSHTIIQNGKNWH